MKKLVGGLVALSVALSIVSIVMVSRIPSPAPAQTVVGGVDRGSEYHATSTRNFNGTPITNLTVLKTGQGALGSLVITGAAAGTINFYDATTSDITQRNNIATSTLLIATFPNSLVAGTYTIDSIFQRGLLIETLGTTPTSTATFR